MFNLLLISLITSYIVAVASSIIITIGGVVGIIKVEDKHLSTLIKVFCVQILAGGIGMKFILENMNPSPKPTFPGSVQASLGGLTQNTEPDLDDKKKNKIQVNQPSIDNCKRSTLISEKGCTSALNYLKDKYNGLPLAIEWVKIKKFTTHCHVSEGIEARFSHPEQNVEMEIEFDNDGKLIETEFQNLPIKSLDKDIKSELYFKYPNFSRETYEKEIHPDGSVVYEFELDNFDNDVAIDRSGQWIPNTCEGGTSKNPNDP